MRRHIILSHKGVPLQVWGGDVPTKHRDSHGVSQVRIEHGQTVSLLLSDSHSPSPPTTALYFLVSPPPLDLLYHHHHFLLLCLLLLPLALILPFLVILLLLLLPPPLSCRE